MSDDVIVVGGGIVGASIAYHLRSADRPVRLFERDDLGGHTTMASAGQVTHHQARPDRRTYARRQLASEWFRANDADGAFGFQRLGTIHAARDADELASLVSAAETLASFGATTAVHPDGLSAYGIDSAVSCGGVELPDDGPLDQEAVVSYMLAAASREGVAVDAGVEVTDVEVSHGRVTGVQTTAGTYDATTVINAAGPWAPRLNAMADVSAPLRHTAGPMAVVEVPGFERELPLTLLPDGYYLRRSAVHDEGVLVGSFATDYDEADQLGSEILDTGSVADGSDPDSTRHRDPGDAFIAAVPDVVTRSLSDAGEPAVVEQWLGHRTVTPDGRPIVDRSPVDGFVLACGMSGYGVTLGPAIGKLMATWLVDGDRPALLDDLGLGRFDQETAP